MNVRGHIITYPAAFQAGYTLPGVTDTALCYSVTSSQQVPSRTVADIRKCHAGFVIEQNFFACSCYLVVKHINKDKAMTINHDSAQ